jgi:hypothetical protein
MSPPGASTYWIFAGSIPNSEGKERCHNLIEVCSRLLASTLFKKNRKLGMHSGDPSYCY